MLESCPATSVKGLWRAAEWLMVLMKSVFGECSHNYRECSCMRNASTEMREEILDCVDCLKSATPGLAVRKVEKCIEEHPGSFKTHGSRLIGTDCSEQSVQFLTMP